MAFPICVDCRIRDARERLQWPETLLGERRTASDGRTWSWGGSVRVVCLALAMGSGAHVRPGTNRDESRVCFALPIRHQSILLLELGILVRDARERLNWPEATPSP